MSLPKKIVIVAGEESGDLHAASLVKQLLSQDCHLSLSGIGGKHMQAAGVELIYNLAHYGITGLTAIVFHLKKIKQAFREIQKHLQKTQPDLLILVDYPGFNLRLAKYAKSLGCKILYYISPQIWAWKAHRIHTIKAYVDHMAVIFPFEKKIYAAANIPVSYVGHPLVKKINQFQPNQKFRESLNIPLGKKIVALLPGSRRNEIIHHLPPLLDMIGLLQQQRDDVHYLLPLASTLKKEDLLPFLKSTEVPLTLIAGQALDVIAISDCALVASGTASLEAALFVKPMAIIYKGSLLSYIAAMKLIKVKYLGLANLLMGKMIVPELLQYDCNPQELAQLLLNLLDNEEFSAQITRNLNTLKKTFMLSDKDCALDTLVLQLISS